MLVSTPRVIRPAAKLGGAALTGAVNPPNYFFEATVNDAGVDDGKPRLFVIAVESDEVNVYKVSLAHGDSGTANAAVTTTNTTLTDTREAWTTDEWIGETVTCNSKTMTVTGNTATVLTGTSWSGGGNPGDGNEWIIGVGPAGTLLNTKTFTVTTTQPMGHPAEWNDGSNTRWLVPLGDGGFIQRLDSVVSGTSADTWTSDDADARHLKVVGNQLVRSTDENQVSILSRGVSAIAESGWGGDFFAGDVSSKITELGEASGLGYIAKEDGFYEWDLEGEAANVFPEIGRAPRNGQGMVYWHGGFLIPAASGLWWTRTGKPIGPDSNPNNSQNHPVLSSIYSSKGGHWMGLYPFGEYIFGIYITPNIPVSTTALLLLGRERESADPPGWGPIIWHVLDFLTADLDDFHGCFVSETSEISLAETRPSIWYASGTGLLEKPLDRDGAPRNTRGDISVLDAFVYSGEIDFGIPRVLKQLWMIDGWAEDMTVDHVFYFSIAVDGGATIQLGANITEDGYFQRFWTQDSNDTARAFLVFCKFEAGSNRTGLNGPHLRDAAVRAIALPATTREWTFLFGVEDEQSKTAKKIRSELEAYVGDLKKFTLPDRDFFNGVMGKPRMLRADEINRLTPRNQEPPHYVIAATVREMSGS
jgi:hypothetical protein